VFWFELSLSLLFEWGSKGLIVNSVLLEERLSLFGEGQVFLGHSQNIFKFLCTALGNSHYLWCIYF
jgi:hypothetical protein